MNGTATALLCLASAPMALLPASLALFTRHPSKWVILLFNVVLWLGALALVVTGIAGGVVSIVVALILWLVLFKVSISAARPGS